ncbi:MAG: hypothetical protein Q8L24_02990 [bacterium]|nr:hypothetical protein [bacterium]
MNHYTEKLAKILRVDKDIIAGLASRLDAATGKSGVIDQIIQENEKRLVDHLWVLGLNDKSTAHEVFDALISKVESDDLSILNALKISGLPHSETAEIVAKFVLALHPAQTGLFLKYEKAKELLRAEPPQKILSVLGYSSIDELLAKEDLLEVFSALRFFEDSAWLNNTFFKQYEKLTPDDFEERPIQLRALGPKWALAAKEFVEKKFHNISHLKELGVIFIIPIFLGISGETLRTISLLLHYLSEVEYYSELFAGFAKDPSTFANKVISLLRGDVLEHPLPQITDPTKTQVLVVQRYLAKSDVNDWRLFVPHINPEALHWARAKQDLEKVNEILPGFSNGMEFWTTVESAGDFFKTDVGVDVFASFNLVDIVMELVMQKEKTKYFYHHQEAIWNRIFTGYLGEDKVRELTMENILRGWFEI